MYFCPKCNYSFDISKSTITSDDRKPIDEPREILKRFKSKKNLSNYVATFPKEDLIKNKIFNTLDEQDQQTFDVIFNEHKSQSGIEFKCLNCNYRKQINESIVLYQMNIKSFYKNIRSIEDNKLLAANPIYPRTKDYTCKNVNCITHTNDLLKEAVFFREKESYETNYMCTVCFNNWLI